MRSEKGPAAGEEREKNRLPGNHQYNRRSIQVPEILAGLLRRDCASVAGAKNGCERITLFCPLLSGVLGVWAAPVTPLTTGGRLHSQEAGLS